MKKIESINRQIEKLQRQKTILEQENRLKLERRRDELLAEIQSINSALGIKTPQMVLKTDNTRRIYAFANVGDAILEVLPTTINRGLTLQEIVTAINDLPNSTKYSYQTIAIGLGKYFDKVGVSGYRIRHANNWHRSRKTYYKRRNGGEL